MKHPLDEDGKGFCSNMSHQLRLESHDNSTDMLVIAVTHQPYMTGTKIDKHFLGTILAR